MRTFLRDNGLTIALCLLFLASLAGQIAAGFTYENETRVQHGLSALAFASYITCAGFFSALFENWESEFLQMCAYVTLTAYLFQRGSPESKDPDKPAPEDRDPALDAENPDAPWPVRAGGLVRAIYAHSLGWTLGLLFLVSFSLHFLNSWKEAGEEALEHHEAAPTLIAYFGEARFWFESFQNWQSEFLSTAVLVVLAIFLRERGSPESKPVSAPHSQTGTD